MKTTLNSKSNVQSLPSARHDHNTMLGAGLVTHEIFPNDALCVSKESKQFRFPKSKKVRIRKKWSKKSINFKSIEVRKIVLVEDRIYMPSKQYFQYKEAMLNRKLQQNDNN